MESCLRYDEGRCCLGCVLRPLIFLAYGLVFRFKNLLPQINVDTSDGLMQMGVGGYLWVNGL